MEDTLILAKLKDMLRVVLKKQENTINFDENDKLVNLGISSLSFIQLSINIELEFGFEFGDSELDYSKFDTLKSLSLYIKEKISA